MTTLCATPRSRRSMPVQRVEPRGVRVLHVIPSLYGGGMERALVRLILATAGQHGPDATLIQHGLCVLTDADPVLLAACRSKARVWVLAQSMRGMSRPLRCWWRLRRVVRHFHPDIVHARSTGAWIDAAAAVRGMNGTRLVLSFHGKETLGQPGLRRRLLNRWSTGRAGAVLAVSRQAAAEIGRDCGIPPEKLAVMPNGVDVDRFRPPEGDEALRARERLGLSPRERVVTCVANLMPIKAIDVLLRAWSQVRAGGSMPRLLLIGDGPMRADLERMARTSPGGEQVRFLGSREDVPDLLRSADLAVLPSRYEACSNAILEAMATGLPVVACDVGGNRELIEPGRTGWLVAPDAPDVLADCISGALGDDVALRRAGAEARQTAVRSFGLDQWAAEYARFYRSLVDRCDPGGSRGGRRPCVE